MSEEKSTFEPPYRVLQYHSKEHEPDVRVGFGIVDEELSDFFEGLAFLRAGSISYKKGASEVVPIDGLISQFDPGNRMLMMNSRATGYSFTDDLEREVSLLHYEAIREFPFPVGMDVHTFGLYGDHELCDQLAEEFHALFVGAVIEETVYGDGILGYKNMSIDAFRLAHRENTSWREWRDYAAAVFSLTLAAGPYKIIDPTQVIGWFMRFRASNEFYKIWGRKAGEAFEDATKAHPGTEPKDKLIQIGLFLTGQGIKEDQRIVSLQKKR